MQRKDMVQSLLKGDTHLAMTNIYQMLREAHVKTQCLANFPLMQINDYIDDSNDTDDEEYERQLALEECENEQEEKREEYYDQHVKLVNEGMGTRSVDWFSRKIKELPLLTDPLPRFNQSEKQGIPLSTEEDREEDCLFDSILKNAYFEKHEKIELIKLALTNGYGPYYTLLLSSPRFDDISMDKSYHPLIRQLYLYLLTDVNNPFLLNAQDEQCIWMMFWEASEGHTVFNALMRVTQPSPDTLMNYIVFWTNQMHDEELVVDTFEQIENKMRRQSLMAGYLSDIQKIGKQRILAIEFEKNMIQQAEENTIKTSSETPVVSEFLNKHRYSFFFGRFGRTTSTKISNMIQSGDVAEAQTIYLAEKKLLEDDIIAKLSKEPGYHPEFHLR